MMLQPDVAQDMIVVSEIGEAWSPKIEPPNMAPAVSGIFTPMSIAIGRAMTAMIAMVPIDVPVAKDKIMAMMNVRSGRRDGVRNCIKIEDRYAPVPSCFTSGPSVKARHRMVAIPNMVHMPFSTSLVSSSSVNTFSARHMTEIESTDKTDPQSRACIPAPLVRLPEPVT